MIYKKNNVQKYSKNIHKKNVKNMEKMKNKNIWKINVWMYMTTMKNKGSKYKMMISK